MNDTVRMAYESLKDSLTKREQEVITYRLAGLTLEEVGKKYNVTRERIRQSEVSALRKLGISKQPLSDSSTKSVLLFYWALLYFFDKG